MPTSLATPRTILLVKTSSLGDVVHNLPVVSDLHRQFPAAHIDWLVEEAFAEIPRLHPAVRQVIPVALRRWRKSFFKPAQWCKVRQERQHFQKQLQTTAYDIVLDTQGLIKSALLVRQARLSPNGRRCGYAANVAREGLAARSYDDGYAIPRALHAVERNRQLAAAALGYALDAPHLAFDYGLDQITPLRPAWLPARPYVVLLTATSRDDKLWPEADWQTLIADLAQQGLQAVLPAGAPHERLRAERIASSYGCALNSSVAPPLSISELAQLCAGAQCVIGVDTGLTHLAAALGRPSLALFCASEPGLTGVYAGSSPSAAHILNLGSAGKPPSASAVIHATHGLLTAYSRKREPMPHD